MNILVTGGTSGLGGAIVKKMLQEKDSNIIFTYCNNVSIAQEIMSQHDNAKGVEVDYTDENSVNAFVKYLTTEHIDVLINNAYTGNPLGTYFHKTAPEDYALSFMNNVIPVIKITQACIRGMRKRKYGKIVNIITSYIIDTPPAGFSVYTSTKAYIKQLSRSWSKEYGRFNITSNCILPEYMHTGFGKIEEFQLEQMISSHPLKQVLKAEEVAEIICYVIHSSQQLNGAEIPINAAQHII